MMLAALNVSNLPMFIRYPVGGWGFVEKIVCYCTGATKSNTFNKVCSSFSEHFLSIFPWLYKYLHITQKLTCIKHL